ncbi:MAG: AAA family ATPase [Lachnospiraceae bacterium]|nr:AAA family ATPase [Lachnospiraceae bacterium]
MGVYLNPSNRKFQNSLNSKIYVDKSGLIEYTNSVINTRQQYICVSRPRRFGKSMAAEMLAAYYGKGIDSEKLFQNLKIAQSPQFLQNLNQYDVIFLNMQEFLSNSNGIDEMLDLLRKSILWDLMEEYSDIHYFDRGNLTRTLKDIYAKKGNSFVIIIDEWDCIFRFSRYSKEEQEKYLDFLRDFLKDKEYVALAYMTGILPIKKYGTHSALNMFDEFSMTNPGPLAEFVGFTSEEVENLCREFGMDYEEIKRWYDGYHFGKDYDVYSPRSVVSAMLSGKYDNYWNQTETFEALKIYIEMNFEGLKDAVIEMLAGGKKKIDIRHFTNDMTTFHGYEDVLTLLVHLGYLGYDFERKEVSIPNSEIADEYVTAVKAAGWGEIVKSVQESAALLQATWEMREDVVAEKIAEAHLETAHLQYNDENALSYTIDLAYYSARQFYTLIREFPTGKGFADIVFLPRKKYADKPAIIVELKWDESADGAIRQIEKKEYIQALKEYSGNLLLVGVNYNKKSRKHECRITECRMEGKKMKTGPGFGL